MKEWWKRLIKYYSLFESGKAGIKERQAFITACSKNRSKLTAWS